MGRWGTILKAYREWQISGDDDFLRQLWPGIQRAIAYAWDNANPHAWDRDKDGVMEGRQHNTYDIEYFGPNTMMGSLYLGALKACAHMATHLGEPDKAAEYQAVYDSGLKKTEDMLWNGEYYEQKIMVSDMLIVPEELLSPLDPFPKYQYGKGCLSDQLLGQWLSPRRRRWARSGPAPRETRHAVDLQIQLAREPALHPQYATRIRAERRGRTGNCHLAKGRAATIAQRVWRRSVDGHRVPGRRRADL